MKKKYLLTLSVILLLIGLCVLFYPMVSQFLSTQELHKTVDEFDKNVLEIYNSNNSGNTTAVNSSNDSKKESTASENTMPKYNKELLAKLYKDMQIYNKALVTSGGQDKLCDPFGYAEPSFDLSSYGIYDNMFGYISIPQINLEMPIYLGANDSNLWEGAAHLGNTSVPIGGNNTNTVLAGHRGVINKVMFDNIVFLKTGEDVFIKNFWGTLHYKVTATKIIDPTESQNILIQKGKDMLTLITCHPYGYSDQRYLVFCERVK